MHGTVLYAVPQPVAPMTVQMVIGVADVAVHVAEHL